MRPLQLIVFLLFLGAPSAGEGALRTFYVDPAGNDLAAGGDTTPWRTLQHAANVVEAGDLVIVRAGQYAGFDIRTSGTSVNPIEFHADPGVVVNTPNPVTPNHGINLEGASWVVIQGFTVQGMPRAGIRSVTNHHVTIRGNVMDGNTYWGFLSGFSDDLLIENNEASHSQIEHGIYVSNSGDRPIIRRNHVWDNHANGIHMNGDVSQGGDGVITGALVEGNIIHGNGVAGGSGINCDGVEASRFQNNLLYSNHAGGITLYQIDGGDVSKNNVVVHNTIVQASDGRWAINITGGATGNTVQNNILYNFHSFRGSITISPDSLAGFVSDWNVVMDRFSVDDGETRITLAQWRAATGLDLHSLIAVPTDLFVNAAAADYRLKATSPARDAGVTLAEVTVDITGAPRPVGATSDIGAYQVRAGHGAERPSSGIGGRGGDEPAHRHRLRRHMRRKLHLGKRRRTDRRAAPGHHVRSLERRLHRRESRVHGHDGRSADRDGDFCASVHGLAARCRFDSRARRPRDGAAGGYSGTEDVARSSRADLD